MREYKEELVGKQVGRGADCIVYQYADDSVIKFSTSSFFFGNLVRKKLHSDYLVCKKYLTDYVVTTEFIQGNKKFKHIEIQPYISRRYLCLSDLSRKKVAQQFCEIVQSLEEMEDSGISPIDLIGAQGVLRMRLSNILIDEHDQLHIIDATLFEAESFGWIKFLLNPMLFFIKMNQAYIVRRFLERASV